MDVSYLLWPLYHRDVSLAISTRDAPRVPEDLLCGIPGLSAAEQYALVLGGTVYSISMPLPYCMNSYDFCYIFSIASSLRRGGSPISLGRVNV